jgi:hypothetical protein
VRSIVKHIAAVGVAVICAVASGAYPSIAAAGEPNNSANDFAGYVAASHIMKLKATIVVPRVVCHGESGLSDIDVSVSSQHRVASADVVFYCSRSGKPEYGASVYAGKFGAVIQMNSSVKVGQRLVVVIAADRNEAKVTMTDGKRLSLKARAKGMRAGMLHLGASLQGSAHLHVRPIWFTKVTVDSKALRRLPHLNREAETQGSTVIMPASSIRRCGTSFAVRQG